MELRQLKYFLTVAEEGLIVKAAEKLNMTQPPLSQQLMQLEKELGSRLFVRSRKRIQLTESGRILQRRAVQMLELMNRTAQEIDESAHAISGCLSLGVGASFSSAMLPAQVARFHQRHPAVTFELHQGDTLKIMELLRVGIIEIGFVRAPFNMQDFDFILLPPEPMLFAACDIAGAAADGQIGFPALAGKPLLLHRRHIALITQQCQMQGFDPLIFCTSDDTLQLLRWAEAGLGIAVVPESAGRFTAGQVLHFYRPSPSALTTTGAIIYPRHLPFSTAAAHFIQMLQTKSKTSNPQSFPNIFSAEK